MEYEIHNSNDELIHWGIKGMRWGVRRYQNSDGTLTTAGRKRYNAELAKVRQEEKTLKNRQAVKARMERLDARKKAVEAGKKELDDEKSKFGFKKKPTDDETDKTGKSGKIAKKSIKDMTEDELNAAINRARLEDTYRQLRPEQTVEKHPMMKKFVDEAVVPAAMNAGKQLVAKGLENLVAKAAGGKADPNSLEAITKMNEKLQAVANNISLKNQIARAKNSPNGDLAAKDQKTLWDLENAKRNQANDDANAAKAAAEAKREAAAAEKARVVNAKREAQSRAGSDSALNRFVNKTTETQAPRPATKNVIGDAVVLKDQVYLPNSFYNKTLNKYSTPSSVPSTTVNNGKAYVDNVNWGRYDLSANRWDDD